MDIVEAVVSEFNLTDKTFGINNKIGPFEFPGDKDVKELIKDSVTIADYLKINPYSPAETVAGELNFSRDDIILAYKMIQSSKELQKYLHNSANRDYFNVVNHYFNSKFYTVVFFVGRSCPARCSFCPNVTVHDDGSRSIMNYEGSRNEILTHDLISDIFNDLKDLKESGTDILVKISGGLEPLTDMDTIEFITEKATDIGIAVKIFTNGVLFDEEKRREIAVRTHDIRISLSTHIDEEYEEICFGKNNNKNGFKLLKDNIIKLVKTRDRINPECKIGFNSVIMDTNYKSIPGFIQMAADLGVDYVDFKPDYFSEIDDETERVIQKAVENAKKIKIDGLFINFVNSISRDNFFWREWDEECNAIEQSHYKIFITPFGHLSPVHYGAYPHSDKSFEKDLVEYSIGKMGEGRSFAEMLKNPSHIPHINLNKLNPFELMLALEIKRELEDEKWGVPVEISPYHATKYNH